MLGVVARASGFHAARDNAYRAMAAITLEGGHYRTDIAERVAR